MQILITPTPDIDTVDGRPARRWLGLCQTPAGYVTCDVWVALVQVDESQPGAELFAAELLELSRAAVAARAPAVLAEAERRERGG